MTPERWQQIKTVFDDVLERPAGEREAYLVCVCGEDGELLTQVKQLIANISKAESFLESPSMFLEELLGAGSNFYPNDLAADRFRIISLLGSDGMGEVYEASDK